MDKKSVYILILTFIIGISFFVLFKEKIFFNLECDEIINGQKGGLNDYKICKIIQQIPPQIKLNESFNMILFQPYMRNVEKRIKSNWLPPKTADSNSITVRFIVDKNGNARDLKITESSKNSLADKAALEAIEISSPFPALPKEFKEDSVPIEFTFSYNVLNKF